jgi:hypothetical protein
LRAPIRERKKVGNRFRCRFVHHREASHILRRIDTISHPKELEMKKLALFTVSIALVSTAFASSAFAQEKTRAEVRQELIQAEQNGSQFVTDASYPDVAPIYQQQVARQKTAQESEGAGMSGTHAAGSRMPAAGTNASMSSCVGPVSYCSVYFGS